MRWDGLFDDLEAQAEALARSERAAEIDERTRAEIGSLTVAGRLRAARGLPLRLRLRGDVALAGTLARVGPDWLLLDEGAGREAVVVTGAVLSVRGLARFSADAAGQAVVDSRLTVRHVLRGVVRDRSPIRAHLVDGSTVDGTLDRVGADFVEVAAHAAGELRRRNEVRESALLPLAALVAVRRGADHLA